MQVKTIVFPNDDGFSVLVWGKWATGSMRVQRFEDRTAMVTLLKSLRLTNSEEAQCLEHFDFLDSCPLYTAEVDEEVLVAHGFLRAE